MQLTQVELVETLSNIISLQNDAVARLFLQKKAESYFRDHLNMHLEAMCSSIGNDSITSMREYKKHDVAILTGTLNRKGVLAYSPTTLIEIKFTNIYWILANEDHPVGNRDETRDNIWRENFRKDPQKAIDETESGIKQDIKKLITSQKSYENSVAIHHVLALTNPHKPISTRYKNAINALNEINNCLGIYGDHKKIADTAHHILMRQLSEVQDTFFPGRKFSLRQAEPMTIGEAFGTKVDLQMFVISELK